MACVSPNRHRPPYVKSGLPVRTALFHIRITSTLWLLCLCASLYAFDTLTVVVPYARIHEQPVETSRTLMLAEPDGRYRIVEQESLWCRIHLGESNYGWIFKRHARPDRRAAPPPQPAPAVPPPPQTPARDLSARTLPTVRAESTTTAQTTDSALPKQASARTLRPASAATAPDSVAEVLYDPRSPFDDIGWAEELSAFSSRTGPRLVLFLWLAAVVSTIALLALLLWRRNRPRPISPPARVRAVVNVRTALVVRRRPMSIKRRFDGSRVSVDACLAEAGFEVHCVSSGAELRESLRQQTPGALVADMRFGAKLHDMVLAYLRLFPVRAPLAVFYNTPADMPSRVAPVRYLGAEFSDHALISSLNPAQVAHVADGPQVRALEGPIGHGTVAEVMQYIDTGAKSGRLTVVVGVPHAEAFFERGSLVHARSATAADRDVAMSMLDMHAGAFRFDYDIPPPVTTCNLPSLYVLMEWARLRDERERID